jgi:multiple antibiotic resistance protein
MWEQPVLMFTALCALYSPLASVSSYFPVVSRVPAGEQHRLALGLFLYVTIFAQTALWVGEPLLELLGITTDALTAAGGIALMSAAVPLMLGRGIEDAKAEKKEEPFEPEEPSTPAGQKKGAWRSLLLMPATFPLTVGGTTFAIIVSIRAEADNVLEVGALSVAALSYALVTAITVYAAAFLEQRLKKRAREMLQRIAGILLTAIAVTLLAKGIPRLVVETLKAISE